MDGSWERNLEALRDAPERLRAFARALVSDPNDADDLAQDVWAAALSHPAPRGALGAWLAGILRNVRRSERRRRARREALARDSWMVRAREEAAPGDALAAAELQAKLQAKLLAAVTALEEPLRATVLLHFFQELSLAEIGRRLGVSDSTVRSRLRRALELLRERLDREHGGREAWSALLAPGLARGVATAAARAAEVTLVGTKTKLALGALALAAAGLLAVTRPWSRGGGRTERLARAAAAEPLDCLDGNSADMPERAPAPAPSGAREAVGAPPRADPAPHEALVYGAFRTRAGEPVADGWIRFDDGRGEVLEASAGAGGTYSLFGLAPGRWSVRACARECEPLTEELDVAGAAAGERHDLLLEHITPLFVRFETKDGRLLRRVPGADGCPTAIATIAPPPARVLEIGTPAASILGAGYWHEAFDAPDLPADASGELELHAPPPLFVSAVLNGFVLATRTVDSTAEPLVFRIDEGALAALHATVKVRVTDAGGAALADGEVSLERGLALGRGSEPDPAGIVSFADVPAGWCMLQGSFPGYETVRRWVLVRPDQPNDLGTLVLDREAKLRGRVLDEHGEPCAVTLTAVTTRHLVQPMDAHRNEYARSAADGRFEIGGLGRGDVLVVAMPGADAVIPFHADTSGGDAEVELRLPPTAPVRVDPGKREELRFTLADERGTPFSTKVPRGVPFTTRLGPGSYELRVGVEDRIERTLPFEVRADGAPVVLDLSGEAGK